MVVEENDGGSVVRLSGRLVGEFVPEAMRTCSSVAPPVRIDATDLREADADGCVWLAKLIEGGARVENLSRYLRIRVDALRERAGQ